MSKPLEVPRKADEMSIDVVTSDPDALFDIIAKQQRDLAATEANDAECRQAMDIGVTLALWLLQAPIRLEVLLTSMADARVPTLLV